MGAICGLHLFPCMELTEPEVVPLKLSAESAGPSFPTGIITVMSALSVAPSKAWEYSKEGWEYLKERTK